MNIGWHADLGQTNCFVSYTKKSDTNWTQALKATGTFERSEVFNGISSKTPEGKDFNEQAVFLDYGVTLTGLERDTDYIYKVCAGSNVCSALHRFRTAGAKEFSFAWIGDFHAYTPLPKRMSNAVAVLNAAFAVDTNVSFVFSTGDVVAWGGSYSFWQNLYDQDFIKDHMYANVLGNHDNMMRNKGVKPDFFRVANNFPRNGYKGQEGVCYWFLYGDVLFFTFNNEVMYQNPAEQKAAQDWAGGVIKKLKGKYRYIFISEHYQWFNGRNGATSWYANWKDFCDEHHVTLALSGNNHIYERTRPLYHDQVVAEGKGTVYMEVPSSDGDRGVEAGKITQNVEKLAYTYSSHVQSGNGTAHEVKTIGCVLVKVGPDGIGTKLVYLDEKGEHVADEWAGKVVGSR